MKTGVKLTYSDYLLFPEDGKRHEIIGGEHYMTPSPSTRHQRISRNLEWFFQQHLRSYPAGEIFYAPFDVVLSTYDIVEPDLLFVAQENRQIITDKNIQGVPDLVVEILSPGTSQRDQELKKKLYEQYGVSEYWIVDPDTASVLIFRHSGKAYQAPHSVAADN